MSLQTINLGSGVGAGDGEGLRSGGAKINAMFAELYGKTQGVVPVAGGTADDTAAFATALGVAVAAGAVVVAEGDEYNINPATLPVITDSVAIKFGPNTVVNSLQTSGTKLPILRFAGGGLTGPSVSVTALESAYLKDTITVSDASSFAAGDVVLMSENAALQLETQFTGAALSQDFNYREYITIQSIAGNDITFEEFIRFPHNIANSLTVQKVDFLDDVHVSGGIFAGSNAAGGGVQLRYCRNSSVRQIRCVGNTEADKNGGSPLDLDFNWRCTFEDIRAHHTLFGLTSNRNQSCTYRGLHCKRTSNGGIILSGDRFCSYDDIVCDSAGDDNGDAVGISNGVRNCTFGKFITHGARCYSIWMHQSCDDNVFVSVHSTAGITAAINCFGDRNTFLQATLKGHGGAGINEGGVRNRFESVDIEVGGHAILVGSTSDGVHIRGRAVTTSGSQYDISLGNANDPDIEIYGGSRGVNLSGTITGLNRLQVHGPNSYYANQAFRARGWSWARSMSFSDTPTTIQIPGDDGALIDWASQNSGDAAECYRVSLAFSSGLADTVSEYIIVDRQGTLYLRPVYVGSGTYVSFVPTLSLSGGNVQVSKSAAGPGTVIVMVEKF